MERKIVPAESAFAASVGYARAVRVGQYVAVAGTAPVMPDGAEPPQDAYGQARRCLAIIASALAELGAGPEHVIRTRIFLTDARHIVEVGRAHLEVFGAATPATTAVVTGLLDPRWLVEIEADAIVPEA